MPSKKVYESMTVAELKEICKGNPIYINYTKRRNKDSLIKFMLKREKQFYISNRQFLLGDFDKDGLKNIDDKSPFKKSKETVEETKLSDALINVEKHRDMLEETHDKILLQLRRIIRSQTGESKKLVKKRILSRVKSPISIMNKLVTKRINTLSDRIGFMYVGENYKELKRISNVLIKEFKKYNVELVDLDDYYQIKRRDGYKAIHLQMKDTITNFPIEIQLKTWRIKHLSDLNHTLYKIGKSNENNFKELILLAEKADNGSKRAQNIIDNMSDKKIYDILSSERNLKGIENGEDPRIL